MNQRPSWSSSPRMIRNGLMIRPGRGVAAGVMPGRPRSSGPDASRQLPLPAVTRRHRLTSQPVRRSGLATSPAPTQTARSRHPAYPIRPSMSCIEASIRTSTSCGGTRPGGTTTTCTGYPVRRWPPATRPDSFVVRQPVSSRQRRDRREIAAPARRCRAVGRDLPGLEE